MWQTAVLAIVLVLGASIAYILFRETTFERIDQELSDTAETFAQSLTSDQILIGEEDRAVQDGLREFHVRDISIMVYDAHLRVIGISTATPSPRHGRSSPTEQPIDSLARQRLLSGNMTAGFTRLYDGAREYRMYAKPMVIGRKTYVLTVIQSLQEERQILRATKTTVVIVIPLIVLIAGLGGALLADRSLAPIAAMTEQAARIGSGNTDDRLPVHNSQDELGRLAQVFNDLLGRLHEALDRQRQFMADTSHELRTPIAIIRAEVDVTLAQAERSEQEYRETLTTIGSSTRRLSSVISNLFLLARADAGQYPVTRAPTYLTDIVSESVKALRALSEQRAIGLDVHLPDDDAEYEGDIELLHRLVTNLVDNALKHGTPNTTASIVLSKSPTQYIIDVTNHGPSIPCDMQSYIFDRFAQMTSSSMAGYRERGAGLGLPIARWIAERHGGTLALVQSDMRATTFRCTLRWPL